MEAIAKTKYLKGSPQKARLVIDLVRGKNVARALAILKFTNKRAATPIAKCIRSAVANATYTAEQQNIAIDPDDLWIKSCFVDMGPTKNRKRLRPAPQGRAYQERMHYCHITVELTSEEPVQKDAPVKKSAGKKKTKPAASDKKAETKKDSKPAEKKTKKASAPKEKELKETAADSKPAKEAESKKAEPKAKPKTKPKAETKSAPKKETPKKEAPKKEAAEKKDSAKKDAAAKKNTKAEKNDAEAGKGDE